MDKAPELEELKAKLGIADLSKMSGGDFERLQTLVGKKEITREQVEQLVALMPQFIKLQLAYAENLKLGISSVKETQKDALGYVAASLDPIIDLLKEIVSISETEELRSKIVDYTFQLADKKIEIAKILQEMNIDNNNTSKSLLNLPAIFFAGVLGFLLGKKNT